MSQSWIPGDLVLRGQEVTLVPLGPEHAAGLAAAVTDGGLHLQGWTSTPAPEDMAADIAVKCSRRTEGTMVPFAVTAVGAPSAPVGVTCFYGLDPAVPRLSIGYTWIAQSWWSTAVNPEMKYLMLSYAFDTLGCAAVEIRTKGANQHSQHAIEKLGLRRDGVLRRAVRTRDGRVDDAVVYSIIDDEWPSVKDSLERRLAHRFG